MSATTIPLNIRCPFENCNHYLIKDFIGEQFQRKCERTGYTIRIFRENGEKPLDKGSKL